MTDTKGGSGTGFLSSPYVLPESLALTQAYFISIPTNDPDSNDNTVSQT